MSKTLSKDEVSTLMNSILEIGGENLLAKFNLCVEEGQTKGYQKQMATFIKRMNKAVKQQSQPTKLSSKAELLEHYKKEAAIVTKLITRMLTVMQPN